MDRIFEKIRDKIMEVTVREDELLRNIDKDEKKGIFFMPEIAFAYTVGKKISLAGEFIFGTSDFTWEREVKIGNTGSIDLIFEIQDKINIAIEFKIRDTIDAYREDIDKLRNNEGLRGHMKVFCALSDVFADQGEKDARVVELTDMERMKKIRKIGELYSFPTEQKRYESPVHCLISVWKVL